MKTLTAAPAMTEAEAEALAGTFLGEASYDPDRLFREDVRVLREDGSPLLVFRKNALPADQCRAAFLALRTVNFDAGERGFAAGNVLSDKLDAAGVGYASKTRVRRIKKDGTLSNTDAALGGYAQPTSGIVGFFDRTSRRPYCRQTAFNANHPDRFGDALPFIRSAAAVFAREVPDRYAAQKAVCDRSSPDFLIPGTVFSTVTVNRNWQTAVHTDRGDLKEGFGVLCALQAGHYTGGHFVLPRYRVAVDMRSRDVLMVDVHEFHGNTPIVGAEGQYERISCVFYFRENVQFCGSAAEELEFAKARPLGTGLVRAKPREAPG